MIPASLHVSIAASGLDGWLSERLKAAGEILSTMIAPVAVAVIGVALAVGARQLLLRLRGRSPRVQITPFAWASSPEGDREAAWVTSLFREQLGALRLDPLDPLPERAPGAPLVEIVESVGRNVGHGLGGGRALGRLWRMIWPDAAYEVWGTARPVEDDHRRLSVQLVERAHGNRTLISIVSSEASWEESARQAAMAVAGALYPRLKKTYKGPWTLWRKPVPHELIGDYHTALEHEQDNRLEQAMGAYHAALRRDPLNPNLRLRIAMLQERLALDLDAWATYQAIVDESDRDAWKGADRRVRLLALYRQATLLGNERLAEQWARGPQPGERTSKRDKEREELRKRLGIALNGERLLIAHERSLRRGVAGASAAGQLAELREPKADTEASRKQWLEERFKAPNGTAEQGREQAHSEIGEVLQVLGLRRLEELDAGLRAWPPWQARQWREWRLRRSPLHRCLQRRELSRSVIRTSKLLVRIRIAASAKQRLEREGENRASEIAKVERVREKLTSRWPFPATNGRQRAARLLAPGRRWADRRGDAWQLHYNAACTISVLLGEETEDLPPNVTRPEAVRRAVEELEEYAHRAGSDQVAGQADWVAIDDPDLETLARTDEFELWAAHHLPYKLPPERSRRNVDVNRYSARMIRRGALVFAGTWRDRAEERDAPARDVVEWWREEEAAWARLAQLSRERRSWRNRLEGVEALHNSLPLKGKGDRNQLDRGHDSRDRIGKATGTRKELFEAMADLIGDGSRQNGQGGELLEWVRRRCKQVRSAHESGASRVGERGLARRDEREAALHAARLWTRLAEVLGSALAERDGGRYGSCELFATAAALATLEPLRKEVSALPPVA